MTSVTCINAQPAVVVSPIVVQLEAHIDDDDEEWERPPQGRVLQVVEQTVLLDHLGHQRVHVDGWQQRKNNST